jgi:hypothetical protein
MKKDKSKDSHRAPPAPRPPLAASAPSAALKFPRLPANHPANKGGR